MMRTTIEPWSLFLHLVKGHTHFLEKLEPGLAVVERRTKTNSQNVGVAARHVLFANNGGKGKIIAA